MRGVTRSKQSTAPSKPWMRKAWPPCRRQAPQPPSGAPKAQGLIAALWPQHVAEVLAELMGGKCYPFGPLEGAFMAASGDAHGTAIEVYPERATLDVPKNDDQVVFGDNASAPETWPFYVLVSVPLQPEQIEAIGAREGWRVKTFGRGMRGHKPFSMSSSSGSKTG